VNAFVGSYSPDGHWIALKHKLEPISAQQNAPSNNCRTGAGGRFLCSRDLYDFECFHFWQAQKCAPPCHLRSGHFVALITI
jgi:hypothetical protein